MYRMGAELRLPFIVGLIFVFAVLPIGRKAKQKMKAKQEQRRIEKRNR